MSVGAGSWRGAVVVACVALVMAVLPRAADAKPQPPEHAQGRAVAHAKERPTPPAHRQVPDHAKLRAPAHANASQGAACTTGKTASGTYRGRCVFTDNSSGLIDGATVDLQDVVDAVGGTDESGIVIRAWGGHGADGQEIDGALGGAGGSGGYASTYVGDLDTYQQANPFGSATVWFYLGRAGGSDDGNGGASTVVLFGPSATDGTPPVPCIAEQSGFVNGAQATIPAFNNGSCGNGQTLLLDAGGGGGGGQGGETIPGGGAGGGGVAVAGGSSVVAEGQRGADGWDKNGFGRGGSESAEGACKGGPGGQPTDPVDKTRNGGSGTDGIGGSGGGAETHPNTGYQIAAYVGSDVHGAGGVGSDEYGGGGGGGGGGGCGGGGGGGGTANHAGGGGGGGGSFAYYVPGAGAMPIWIVGDVSAPAGTTAGAMVIVVDDVAAPGPDTAQRP